MVDQNLTYDPTSTLNVDPAILRDRLANGSMRDMVDMSQLDAVSKPVSGDYQINTSTPTDVIGKDLMDYFKSDNLHPVANLSKPQKDAASNGFKAYTQLNIQANALPGQEMPNDFELPAYSEIYAPIFAEQFPAMKTPDDLVAHGLVDENGQTEKGKFLLDLKKVGGLNNDYTLNITGKALLSNHEESLKPENLPIFMERKRLGLDKPEEKSWGGVWDELKDVIGKTAETAMSFIPSGSIGIPSGTPMPMGAYMPSDKNAPIGYTQEKLATQEGAASGIMKTEASLTSGARKLVLDAAARMMLDGREQDMILAQMDQSFQRNQLLNQAVKASDVFHEITGLSNWVDQMTEAKQQLGEEGFKKAQQTGEVGGPMLFSLVNPLAPENIAFHAGMSLATAPVKMAARTYANASRTATQFAEKVADLEAINNNLAKAQAAVKATDKIAELEKAQQAFVQAGDAAAAKSIGRQITKVREVGQRAVFQAEQWQKLAETTAQQISALSKNAANAEKITKIADTFAQWPKVITTPVGYTLQKVGQGMTAIDSRLSSASDAIGAGKFYRGMNKFSSLAGFGTLAQTAGLPAELAWFPAAFKAAWQTAPVIEAAGDFIRIVGREASQARGASRMWQRVGRMQNAGATHRLISGLMDTVTLGGFPVIQQGAKGAIKGTIAAVPVDMAFRYVGSGGNLDANSLKESLVNTAFFSTVGGGVGTLKMGSKKVFKQLQMGDVLNYRRTIIDPQQRMMFDALPRGVRDSIGSYSSSNPNLEIVFTKEGGGNIDPNKPNTVYINPNAKNPLKPLIAHELLESMVVHSNMKEAIMTLLVGDGVQTGGLLRDRNGNLDPKFVEFRDRYNQLREAETRRINQTRPPERREQFKPLTDREAAKEYFIEMNADEMAGLAESGKLGRIASRSAATRKMVELGNTILNKASIIRNLHFGLGGMMDSSGKMVMGNGLLADGIRQLPEAQAMFRNMVNNTAGRPGAAKRVAERSKGSVIPTEGMNDPLWSEMTSYWKTDKAGNPIKDSSGNWVPLERHVEQAREQAGLLIQADQKQRIANGESIPKHEIQYSPESGWRGKYFSESQIEIIKNSGYFNDSQIRLFEHINNAAKRGKGERFLMIYNPATSSRLRGRGRKSYETLGPTMKEGGILGFSMGEKGQLLIDIIDTQQLHQNIMEQAGKKIGQKLYKNDIDKIMSDINAVMDLHAKGESADIHFKQEYGADWKAHKDFINSTFGDISGGAKARPADYMMINPVLVTDRPSNAVFKTYRLDRLNKATAMEGTTGIPMDYNMVKANYMPDGVPLFHENGDPVDMRYTPVEDENGNLRAVPSENYGKQNNKQVEETSGLPPEQGIPADRTTAVQTQEGTPLGESTSKEGQVVPPSESSNQYMPEVPKATGKLQPISIAEFKRTASREDIIAVNKALKYISALGREYPESVQLRIQTDKNGIPKLDTLVDSDGVPILDSKGREQRGVVFSQEAYKLRSAPSLSTDYATARRQAAALLEADARAALAHPDSLAGLGWYSRMRKFLQRQLGASIELFGQLLGATSARTPVDANFRQTLEAIREFSSGAYDDLLQRYHQHVESVKREAASGELESEWTKKYESWKKLNPKSAKKKYVEADEIRKKINAFDDVPLRPNGKKFNANSKKVLQALYGIWIEQTVGPKTPNFAGNLTGRTLKATIDVWAARNLRRLLYQGKVKKWRILPEQEKGVDDVDFSFRQDVFHDVAEKLGMNADDLQALMWFYEKGIWAENNWTNTVGGKKSSFDEEANKLSLDRYQAGITTFTDSTRFDPSNQDVERKRIQTSIAALDGLVASRVTHSDGLYGDVVEPSFDVEFSIKRNNDGTSKSISTVINQLIDIAKNQNHRQMDTFVSQVVDNTHPNARPMVEIGFKSPASKADIDAVTGFFKNLGIDGFTVAKDQRGNVIGIRAQYIPEISARYDTPDHLIAEKFLENADKWMNNAESALIEAGKISNVSYTEQGHVSTTVYGTEEYNTATPTDISRTLRETELGRRKAILEQNGGPDNGGSNPVTGFSDDAGRSNSGGNVSADQG